jgi:hypothetical protein
MISEAWYRAVQRRPYMPDWIEDAAKKLKAEAERLKQEEECRRVIAATLLANRPNIFGSLLAAVEKDVDLVTEEIAESSDLRATPFHQSRM